MEKSKNNEVQSVKTNNTNKKGLKIALIIIAIILSIFIIMCAVIFMLNRKDLEKLEKTKQSAIQELTLEDKQIEYGTEINVADLKLPEDTKIYINNEEVTDKYKFLNVGTIKVKETKEISYINFFKKEVKTSVEKDINVEVIDTKKPIIEGVADKEITQGDSINLKNGITAKDEVDGTLDVTIEGTVDTNTVGEYKITAKATDKNGNETTKEFNVKVTEKPVEETSTPENQVNTTKQNTSAKPNTSTNKATTQNKTKTNSNTNNGNTRNATSSTPKTNKTTTTSSGKKYFGPSGHQDQTTPYFCFEGGTHHYHQLTKYEHGWYNTGDEAMAAMRAYEKIEGEKHRTGDNYQVNQCWCGKWYFMVRFHD